MEEKNFHMDNIKEIAPPQEEIIGELSRFAVHNKYRSDQWGNVTAVWMVDIKGLMNYIKENYILIPKK